LPKFEIGQTYYFVSDITSGFKNRVCSGVLTRTTSNFCILDTTSSTDKKKSEKRKLMKLVYETEKECLAILIRRIDREIHKFYNSGILELAHEYQDLMEKFPERFI
jgi:hypothetical protein